MSREGGVSHRGPGRPPRSASGSVPHFRFKTGDLVLVKWNDGMVYFAKIKRIDHKRCKCIVVFDDKSQDEAHFSQIHSVDETTTDIICIKCKKDASSAPNEIVLCDTCGIGFHQKCHNPQIPASALVIDTPWNCIYCLRGTKCPYLTESLDVLQNLLSDDNDSNPEEEMSDHYEEPYEKATGSRNVPHPLRKRRGRKPAERATRKVAVDRRAITTVERRSLNRSNKLLTTGEGSKSRLELEPSPMHIDSDTTYSPGSTPEPSSGLISLGKRKKAQISSVHHHRHKRHKRSSVEARTVSVTRVAGHICTDDSSASTDTPSRDSTFSDDNGAVMSPVSMERQRTDKETKPRSLRVSLTFPEDVEPGTPLDKIKKLASPTYTKPSSLPPWEEFTSKSSSPSLTLRSPVDVSTPSKTEAALQKKSSPEMAGVRQSLSRLKALGQTTTKTPTDTLTPSPFEQRKVSPSADEPFKASPLPSSSSTSPQLQLKDDSLHTSQPKVVSLPVQVDVRVTSPTLIRTTNDTKLIEPKAGATVACATQATAEQHQPTKASQSLQQPQLSKAADGPDRETQRPVILATTKTQTPGFTHEQNAKSFEAKAVVITTSASTPEAKLKIIPSPVVVESHTSTPAVKHIPSPVVKPHTPIPAVPLPAAETHIPTPAVLATAVSAAAPSVQPKTGQQLPVNQQSPPRKVPNKTVSPPASESDVIITGVEHARGASQVVAVKSPVISPVQAQTMLIDGHRRAHELNEITMAKATTVTSAQRPKKVTTKTVEIQQPPVNPQPQGGPVLRPVPSQTPVVPLVVTPTGLPAHKVPTTSQQSESSAETPARGIQTLYYRMQDQNGQQVYIPVTTSQPPVRMQDQNGQQVYIPVTTSQPPVRMQDQNGQQVYIPVTTSQPPVRVQDQNGQQVYIPVTTSQPPVRVIVAGEAAVPQQITDTSSNVAFTTVRYTASDSSGSHPVQHQQQQTQPHVYYTTVAQTSASGGRVGVSTTKPYAIVNALPVSSVEYTAVTRPQNQLQPTTSSKVATPQTNVIAVEKRDPPPYEAVTKQNDPTRRAHTVLVHTTPQSNTTPKVAPRVDKEEISTISKKVGDALTNMNPEMLLSAFEDAWNKFQANEKIYKAQPRKQTAPVSVQSSQVQPQRPPPNVEVIPSTSRAGLLRQMGTRPRMIAPKPFSRSPASTPPLSVPLVNTATPSSEYAAPQPQQVVLRPAVYAVTQAAQQQAAQQQQQKTYQVQTAGLFYPASGTGAQQSAVEAQQVSVLQQTPRQAKVIQAAPRQINETQSLLQRQTALVQQSTARQATVVQKAPYQAQQNTVSRSGASLRRKGVITSRDSTGRKSTRSNRHCARCGGDATYLCSGCHTEWYCGRECQLKAWDAHSERCKA